VTSFAALRAALQPTDGAAVLHVHGGLEAFAASNLPEWVPARADVEAASAGLW